MVHNRFRRAVRLLNTMIAGRQLAHIGPGTRLGLGFHVTDPLGLAIGDNCRVSDQVSLNAKRRADGLPSLQIGNRCLIGRFVQISSLHSVVIEDDVLISDRVWIGDEEHPSSPDMPISVQPTFFRGPVTVRRGGFIGVGAVIRPGVTVGCNAVVGANAVVTRHVPDFAVVAGVPARVIGSTTS